jgi:hypothetical protein
MHALRYSLRKVGEMVGVQVVGRQLSCHFQKCPFGAFSFAIDLTALDDVSYLYPYFLRSLLCIVYHLRFINSPVTGIVRSTIKQTGEAHRNVGFRLHFWGTVDLHADHYLLRIELCGAEHSFGVAFGVSVAVMLKCRTCKILSC